MSDDSPLDPFAEALRCELDEEAGAAGPDLIAVVEEAHARAPRYVSSDMVEKAAMLANVVPLKRRREELETALRPFAAAMEAELEAVLEERTLAELPRLRQATVQSRRSAALGWGLGLAAALALLFITARPMLFDDAGRGRSGVEALRILDSAPSGRAIGPTGPRLEGAPSSPVERVRETASVKSVESVESMESATLGAVGTVNSADTSSTSPASEGLETAADESASAKSSPTKPRPRVATGNQLAALDSRAQAAWRRGELGVAERFLLRLTELGGRTGRAELAYGDLFTLAYQQGKPPSQRRYWRAYLRVFPRGRFADDARAGLCRQREGDKATTCWRRYLAQNPQGSHSKEANEALAGLGKGPP